MSKIRTEISIESCESFVVKRKRYSIRTWCEGCGRIAIFVLPTEAGFLAGLDVDTIVLSIYTGELHVHDAPGRGIYVCLTSLCMRLHSADRKDDEGIYEEIGLVAGYEEPGLSTQKLE